MAESAIRVDPQFVEFKDIKVGHVYKTTVTVTNIGKTLKKIIIEKPKLKLFKFRAHSPANELAPGLSVSNLLEFIPEEEEEVRYSLLIHVDDSETIKIPLLGLPRACLFQVDSVLDFGCIVASSQVVTKHHAITNQGAAPGMFQVQYKGDPTVQLSPLNGIVAAGATQWLKVELHADMPRLVEEKALINLQNCSAVSLSIRAEVVDQHLEIFDTQGAQLSCLWFGPVYFGTSRIKYVILRNNAPRASEWVSVLQNNAAGTEVGIDLQKSTDAPLLEGMKRCSPTTQDVLVCVPNQGELGPYENTTVAIRFSPVNRSVNERKKREHPAPRQDYCVFLQFESLQSRHGFTRPTANSSVELAVTGSGLPVSLVPSPSRKFDFLTCVMGQSVDALCVLQNLCPQLPVNFKFRKLAHFTTKPSAGIIRPGQSQDIVLSFKARQQGSFQMSMILDVLGHVVHESSDNLDVTEIRSFHTITLQVSAVCHSETKQPVPNLNSGITPAISNPSGLWPYVPCSSLARCCGMVHAAILCANKTQLHAHHREKGQDMEEFLAFPNDRASSIRPPSSPTQYRTIFTGLPRYCYVDTNYAFTEEEEEQRQQHRQKYRNFIDSLRQTRLSRIKEKKQKQVEEDDIGIIPSQGLVPPELSICDIANNKDTEAKSQYQYCSTGNKYGCSQGTMSATQQIASQVSDEINAVPTSDREVADCSRTLTAQELFKVCIGPLLVDFGKVCVQSTCVQTLELINHLSAYVWVQLEVDCPELQGSSPLSHVLPPCSRNTLPLTFQSNKSGHFYRPVSYSINKQHPGQILVQAQVVSLALELSTTHLVLSPTPILLARSEYRTSVTLRNQLNHAAEFTWRPVVTERGIMFSIRPASGTVEPYRELDCEVVWHPSFSSPAEGDFDLCVHEGNTERLHCIAKIGYTSIELTEKLIKFESVPLNRTSIRTAILHNSGQKHAYYQVLDVCPLPGMVVSPSEGVVPSGGQTSLIVRYIPESVIKFDTRVKIALRNMKSIELRMCGSVERPRVDISLSHFQFYGVFAGSQRVIPFTLTNRSPSEAQITFNMSDYPDFCFQFPRNSATEPGVTNVEMQGYQTVTCSLIFSPTQEATYDFDVPMMVNGLRWSTCQSPSPSMSSSSTSSQVSRGNTKQSVKHLFHSMAAQQSLRIQATALCAPVELSPSSLQFDVESSQSNIYTKTLELKAVFKESIYLYGVISKYVHWWFDCSVLATQIQDSGEEDLCTVSPSSGSLRPDQSISLTVSIRPESVRTVAARLTRISLPLYLGSVTGGRMEEEERHQPYRELSISINLQLPSITINPHQILFTPVPLEINATCTLTMTAVGYSSGTTVKAEVEEVELEDGTKIQPVSVNFAEGNFIPAQTQDQKHPVGVYSQEDRVTPLMCSVSFCSNIPLSFCTTINFTDHIHNKFKVKLYATAENCLLTAWPYLALHRTGQQIVLKTGATTVEAFLQPYHTPSSASGLASSSSSFDHSSSTNKNSSSDSYPESDSVSRQTCRNEEIAPKRVTPTCHNLPVFPDDNSDEGLYHQNVLLAVEKWFSLFGWPSGPHPIRIPHTLRRVVSKAQKNYSSGRTYRVSQSKDSRSVVDMLHHLTGTQIPGIPSCQAFSSGIDQRTNQLLQQNEALLAFLRVQGAYLSHIRPEYLLDVEEFKHWCSLQSNEEDHGLVYRSAEYESLSKRCWTDLLLQIYKVLVLRPVSENSLQNTVLNQTEAAKILVDSQPLASNIYSASELQLLSWLNMHYQRMRETIWAPGVPSARWIVNFDLDLTDGLVLGALVAAFCPYLIYSHFQRMYITTSSQEQILHNNIIVIQALTALSLNIDVQPTDLSDPNPVQMLMLCAHLYERLPQYLPQHTITLSGSLHSTFTKQVRLKNPSSKPVKYKALLLGREAHLFSLPDGSAVTIPPKGKTEFNVQYSCSFLYPKEAVLLLTSTSAFGLHSSALAFKLKTHVSHITPNNTVNCESPCYQLRVVHLPITNPFSEEAKFKVVLVESPFNPLGPEKKKDSLVQQASSKANIGKTSDRSHRGDMEENPSDHNGDDSEFLSPVKIVCLRPGQTDTLNIYYLPFWPGNKYCSVLLVCPQVGDMVYIVKATAELPLASPLTARPSSNIVSVPSNSDSPECASALSLCCEVEQVCEEVLRVPLINVAWEQALVVWGQHSMSDSERRRRMLTHSLHSSTAKRRAEQGKVIEYNVDISLPQYFTLPSTVKIPIEDYMSVPWENPTGYGCVDIPLRFQADSVGKFTCQVVLRSWCDTRVFILEAVVAPQTISTYLDFSAPVFHSVTQDIPLHNDTKQDWNLLAELSGEGFCGLKDLNVAAGTRACYPLTFKPSAWGIVKGKLSLYNSVNNTEHVFTLRGVGELPLPVNHVVVQCTVGKTTHTQLNVPNHSQKKLTFKVVTDLSIVSGTMSFEIKPGHSTSYTLAVTPQKRGTHTGQVSFIDTTDIDNMGRDVGCVRGHYEAYFTLEIICEPAAPAKIIHVQCVAESSVAIEIPVSNPEGELLMLNVYLEGANLSGASVISIPPWETLTYKATFSPDRVGKSTGSVIFQSELVSEVWYQLELYALPPPVVTLPQACCQLGKWTRLTIPLVNPEADTVELVATNSNPRNYSLEINAESALILEPHSSTQLNVCFRPSSIGEGNHTAKITFTCPQLQDWCVLLQGFGLNPEIEELVSISSVIGSTASVTIPFTNPTELPATLKITLTDSATPEHHPATTDKGVFFIPLGHTEGIKISEGDSFDVPVVFAPESKELQQIWLCITMKPLKCPDGNFSTDAVRLDQEVSDICWIYPLCGIPMEMPANSMLGEIQCEAGCQLEKKIEVPLGCVLGNQNQKVKEIFQVPIEDLLCEVCANSEADQPEVEDCLSATIKAARRDPETGIVTLTLNLLYTPLKPHRHSVVLAVQYLSSRTWEFPVDLNATDPLVDDVITIKAVEMGKTSAVGFRLTSTTRCVRPEPFTVQFVSGSSREFTVSPISGMLPPVGSIGALITVSFTPIAHCKRHSARLSVQAEDMQWTYEVIGETPDDFPPPVEGSSSTARPAPRRLRNFVTHNLQIPSLANSSPFKVHR
ncbi:cilia- and flagella-associated protein 47-like isoform X3 [Betta splendens]|uniref:Cilia- and flagella-associated protein 47-like isoform X3 n=1 Tax=Betta splendens TaxID=158456 RepID=A0A9W2XGY6_BETSP|nr:cilia- and flagella-associated protein 47-like isoform X3 [Betta splendens]